MKESPSLTSPVRGLDNSPVKDIGQIAIACRQLSDAGERYRKLTEELEKRLAPVTRPSAPIAGQEKMQCESSGVELAEGIKSQVVYLNQSSDRLESILSRVEL